MSGPAPAYVEPTPQIYFRLSYLANAIVDGLTQRQMTGIFTADQNPDSLLSLLQDMRDLGDRLQRLGDIAVKELQGSPLDANDFAIIQASLGPAEQHNSDLLLNQALSANGASQELPPIPAIAAVVERSEQILQVGLGWLDRIYVIVPLEEKLQIAQGGVFSYYEFSQPKAERMTDETWRWTVAHAQPERPDWSVATLLPGGAPVNVLAFRMGDVYRITAAGANLSLRSSPSRGEPVVQRLQPGDLVQIVGGPVDVEGSTWWQVDFNASDSDPVLGWLTENQDWFERVWRE